MPRCRYCGSELAPSGGCPSCDDAGELLTALHVEERDLGKRPEDEYVFLPGAERGIRRRIHATSSAPHAPLFVLIGVIAFVVLAGLLREPADRSGPSRPVAAPGRAPLTQVTHTTLALIGVDGFRTFDVDDRRISTASVAELPRGPIDGATVVDDRVVLVVDRRAYALPATLEGAATPLGPASAAFASARAGLVWLVTAPDDGSTIAREVDLTGAETIPPATLGGGPIVRAAFTGGLVVERVGLDGTRSLLRWDPARPEALPDTIADDAVFVAAAGDVVASRPASCTARRCSVHIVDLATGARRTIRRALDARGVLAASLHEGRLAVLDNAPRRARGTIIDTRTGALARFTARPTPGMNPAAAWDRTGEWLFYLDGGTHVVHAVDVEGRNYAVRTGPLVASGLLSLR